MYISISYFAGILVTLVPSQVGMMLRTQIQYLPFNLQLDIH
jgi:hypothetical protein